MNELKHNITRIHGPQGEQWLDGLPALIQTLSTKWQLHNITPAPNMTYNYVAMAQSAQDEPVVLKLNLDKHYPGNP